MADLRPVDILSGAVRVAGVVELEPTPEGIVLHRMPAWARAQHNDVALALIETMPSGVRLELVTDASCLELDVHLTRVQVGQDPGAAPAFEVVVDGEPAAAHESVTGTLIVVDPATGAIDLRPGAPTTIRFDGLADKRKHVAIWLPQSAAVRLLELRADGVVSPAEPHGRRWVHYGSSISHCMEATRPTGVWPVVAARLAGVDLQSFGFAGQCHLDPFAARMIAAQPADLISLKLGINIVNGDTMRERAFVPAVHGLLDTIRAQHATCPSC